MREEGERLLKKAIISVKGTQKNEQNESDTIELITEGNFYIKGNTFYVVYEESELSGDLALTNLKWFLKRIKDTSLIMIHLMEKFF
jgi:uncharacterized beta-barrel protein YwiB (DUF1934 family)